MSTVDDAINAIKNGNKEEGRQILEQILETDETNEDVWLWLSTVVESDDDREICLENVLAINPTHAVAQNALNAVRDGHFNPQDIIGDTPEQELPSITFHDEFFAETQSDELEMPSVMGGSPEPKIKQKKEEEAKKKKKGLNPRLLLFAVVGVVLACAVLGGVIVFGFMSSGGDPGVPVEAQPGEESPANPAPDASGNTPVAEPSPTPTNTPLLLPTAKPSGEPTPTATQVVSPTPPRAPEEEPEDNGE